MDLSADTLFASLLVSSVGFGFFLLGKKQLRTPQLVVGLALMIYPYFVAGPMAICGIAAGLIGGLLIALRSGI